MIGFGFIRRVLAAGGFGVALALGVVAGVGAAAAQSQAVLIEETPARIINTPASATWSFDTGAPVAQLTIRIEVPSRGLIFEIWLVKSGLPGDSFSHHLTVGVRNPSALPGGGIARVTRFTAKDDPNVVGTPFTGLSGDAVTTGLHIFRIAVDHAAADMALLRDHEIFDLSLTYASGQRAIVEFTKGSGGRAAVRAALAAWHY